MLWIITLIHITYGIPCAYTLDDNKKPIPTDKEPWINQKMSACSFYQNTPVCCTESQDDGVGNDFISLDATFGSDGDGCDICAANMKRFWCVYSCDPRQGEFLKITGRANVTDPRNPNRTIDVQTVTLRIHPQVACDVYSSCKRTNFASQVSAMQTPGGFFTFQAEQGVSSSLQLIAIEFSESNSLIMPDMDNCNQTFQQAADGKTYDPYNFEIKKPCGCNTCEDSCDSEKNLYQQPGVFYGFEWQYVLFAWGWAILFAIGFTVYRQCIKKNNTIQQEEEEYIYN
ncbi:unnamed protein product [Paramecium sonneborni]|uniref:Niemann-Pick C1 N-terminal domain-containing protein n=1 Tax=Paramecium sonneborni TaxID=65129 RepID=A0A8S1RCE8_9CILI|nr:unnamed protein product [Paramecium sonneborni]